MPSKFDETTLKLLHHSVVINDENKYIILCKRVFSKILEGGDSKNVSGGKAPSFSPLSINRLSLHIVCDQFMYIC